MKHLTEEQIIAYIDKTLNEDESKIIEKHVSECDRCFLKYAGLKSSLMELGKAQLTATPEKLKKKAESEIGIEEDKAPDRKFAKFKKRFSDLGIADFTFNRKI
ncbi:MAG: zf-HC2 domain-containing protein [Bacteroidales bacterium]|nr:zf-HC2 domain-containing protein [Bacteroidales bacterium]